VAINHFTTDTDAEIDSVRRFVEAAGTEVSVCRHWAEGSRGTEDLANKVVALVESGRAAYQPLYPDSLGLVEKIETIARSIYHADGIALDAKVRAQLEQWQDAGYGALPICMAKTQYSFTTDPNVRGAPTGHTIPISEVRLASGAGFIVVICGEIMTMPGLPRVPAAESIGLNDAGQIDGLF